MKIAFVIPCLNDFEPLIKVLFDIRSFYPNSLIYVIDDGSDPNQVVPLRLKNVITIRHAYNMGVGAAIKTGLIAACMDDVDVIVTMDSDGQHRIHAVDLLLNRLNNFDMVVGTRESTDYEWDRIRGQAHRFLNKVVEYKSGLSTKDSTSGFRAIGRSKVKKVISLLDDDYLDDTALLLVKCSNSGVQIGFCNVNMGKRSMGTPSHTGLKIVRSYIVIILRLLLIRRA